jgi:hypothetical protein
MSALRTRRSSTEDSGRPNVIDGGQERSVEHAVQFAQEQPLAAT